MEGRSSESRGGTATGIENCGRTRHRTWSRMQNSPSNARAISIHPAANERTAVFGFSPFIRSSRVERARCRRHAVAQHRDSSYCVCQLINITWRGGRAGGDVTRSRTVITTGHRHWRAADRRTRKDGSTAWGAHLRRRCDAELPPDANLEYPLERADNRMQRRISHIETAI